MLLVPGIMPRQVWLIHVGAIDVSSLLGEKVREDALGLVYGKPSISC